MGHDKYPVSYYGSYYFIIESAVVSTSTSRKVLFTNSPWDFLEKSYRLPPRGATLNHVICVNAFLWKPGNPRDFLFGLLRALEIYYWEHSLPCEYPIPTPQTCTAYLRFKINPPVRQSLSRKLDRSELYNISYITSRIRNALCWAVLRS